MERQEEIVVDASVAVKWFSEEEGSERAIALRDRHVSGKTTLVAPDLLVHEVANALRFKPGLSPGVTSRAIGDLFKLQVDLLAPTRELVARASEQAYKYGVTAYDSAYLALGEALGVEVITADGELYRKAQACGFLKEL
jgi:predicted nucleic acid-binding protein